jgi:para-nitrobenzyl esterase
MGVVGKGMAVAAALAGLALAGCAQAAGEQVKVAQGSVEGVTVGQVESFKGIPFAAPPVGDLRWRPPQPPAHWSGVRKADAFGPACMQQSRGGQAVSEDCLFVNVWTPAARPAGARLPVMVWIYGGAFINGAGSVPIYDGTHFAERGVVLVNFNYRLGRFGFFAHPALTRAAHGEAVGNYGLMDQIAALKWVKANIAAFGGDPANVTIFGESAGGISVNYLLGSPAARGLFVKAISESGFGRLKAFKLNHGPAGRDAETIGQAFAESQGVRGDDAAAAAALRALPADKVLAGIGGLSDPNVPAPLIDGQIVTETIAEAFAKGHEAKVPYLEGGNSWEASLFPNVRKDPEPTLAQAGADRAKVIGLYGGGTDLAKVAMDITTDSMITEPDRYLARQLSMAGAPVFVYHFAYVPAAQRAAVPGAGHGSEITYVFDNLSAEPRTFGQRVIPAATADDRKVGDAMIAYWTAFAKTGDPGAAGGVAWPRFDAADTLLEFGADGIAPRRDFEKPRLDWLEAKAAAH